MNDVKRRLKVARADLDKGLSAAAYASAKAAVDAASMLGQPSYPGLMIMGAAALKQNKWSDAADACRAATDLDPSIPAAWIGLCDALYGAYDRDAGDAVAVATKVRELTPHGSSRWIAATVRAAWTLAADTDTKAMAVPLLLELPPLASTPPLPEHSQEPSKEEPSEEGETTSTQGEKGSEDSSEEKKKLKAATAAVQDWMDLAVKQWAAIVNLIPPVTPAGSTPPVSAPSKAILCMRAVTAAHGILSVVSKASPSLSKPRDLDLDVVQESLGRLLIAAHSSLPLASGPLFPDPLPDDAYVLPISQDPRFSSWSLPLKVYLGLLEFPPAPPTAQNLRVAAQAIETTYWASIQPINISRPPSKISSWWSPPLPIPPVVSMADAETVHPDSSPLPLSDLNEALQVPPGSAPTSLGLLSSALPELAVVYTHAGTASSVKTTTINASASTPAERAAIATSVCAAVGAWASSNGSEPLTVRSTVIERAPPCPLAWFALAGQAMDAGAISDTMSALDKATKALNGLAKFYRVSLDPVLSAVSLSRATILASGRHAASATTSVATLLAANPTWPAAHYTSATLDAGAGSLVKSALSWARGLANSAHGDVKGHAGLAAALLKVESPVLATRHARAALSAAPDHAAAAGALAAGLLATGVTPDHPEAPTVRRALAVALRGDPRTPEHWTAAGNWDAASGQVERAVRTWKKALSLSIARSGPSARRLVDYYLSVHDPSAAAAVAAKVARSGAAADRPWGWTVLARLATEAGDVRASANAWRALLRMDDARPDAWAGLAVSYASAGAIPAAAAAAEKAFDTSSASAGSPGSVDAAVAAASAARVARLPFRARELADKAVQLDPTSIPAHVEAARAAIDCSRVAAIAARMTQAQSLISDAISVSRAGLELARDSGLAVSAPWKTLGDAQFVAGVTAPLGSAAAMGSFKVARRAFLSLLHRHPSAHTVWGDLAATLIASHATTTEDPSVSRLPQRVAAASLVLAPSIPDSWIRFGAASAASGRPAAALAALSEAVALDGARGATAASGLAGVYGALSKDDSGPAVHAWMTAHSADPTDPKVWLGLAAVTGSPSVAATAAAFAATAGIRGAEAVPYAALEAAAALGTGHGARGPAAILRDYSPSDPNMTRLAAAAAAADGAHGLAESSWAAAGKPDSLLATQLDQVLTDSNVNSALELLSSVSSLGEASIDLVAAVRTTVQVAAARRMEVVLEAAKNSPWVADPGVSLALASGSLPVVSGGKDAERSLAALASSDPHGNLTGVLRAGIAGHLSGSSAIRAMLVSAHAHPGAPSGWRLILETLLREKPEQYAPVVARMAAGLGYHDLHAYAGVLAGGGARLAAPVAAARASHQTPWKAGPWAVLALSVHANNKAKAVVGSDDALSSTSGQVAARHALSNAQTMASAGPAAAAPSPVDLGQDSWARALLQPSVLPAMIDGSTTTSIASQAPPGLGGPSPIGTILVDALDAMNRKAYKSANDAVTRAGKAGGAARSGAAAWVHTQLLTKLKKKPKALDKVQETEMLAREADDQILLEQYLPSIRTGAEALADKPAPKKAFFAN